MGFKDSDMTMFEWVASLGGWGSWRGAHSRKENLGLFLKKKNYKK